MPIPFPRPLTPPPSPGSTLPYPARTSQWLGPTQDWAHASVRDSHVQALNQMGEYSFFVLLWRIQDFKANLVARCSVCYVGDRAAQVYEQSNDERCPSCFGTTFEAGYKAKIVRPAIWTDDTPDTIESRRGVLNTDTSKSIETTEDFDFHHGDYILRADGKRYQGQELSTTWLHADFSPQDQARMMAGNIPKVVLEDPSSVSYLIPPTDPDDLTSILATNVHYPPDFTSVEDVRGPLV